MSDDARLNHSLQQAFSELSAARGACPSRDDLARYHSGELGEVRAAEIETHTLRCGECDLALDRMERFDAVATDETSVRSAIENSLAKRVGSPAWLSHFWKPALAGAFAAAVLLTISLVLSRRADPQPAGQNTSAKAELAQVFVIPQERAPGVLTALRLSGRDLAVVLAFFAPMKSGLRYTAKVVDPAGNPVTEPVDITSQSQTGHVNLLVSAPALSAGLHRVEVTEYAGSSQPTVLEALAFDVIR